MPICVKCNRMAATAEMRMNPTGPVCRDKPECKRRSLAVDQVDDGRVRLSPKR